MHCVNEKERWHKCVCVSEPALVSNQINVYVRVKYGYVSVGLNVCVCMCVSPRERVVIVSDTAALSRASYFWADRFL